MNAPAHRLAPRHECTCIGGAGCTAAAPMLALVLSIWELAAVHVRLPSHSLTRGLQTLESRVSPAVSEFESASREIEWTSRASGARSRSHFQLEDTTPQCGLSSGCAIEIVDGQVPWYSFKLKL